MQSATLSARPLVGTEIISAIVYEFVANEEKQNVIFKDTMNLTM